jgi:hypothetical protein
MLAAGIGLAACSSEAESAPEADVVETMPSDITPEQEAFSQDLINAGLTTEEAGVLIEENGYTWRLGTIDGEPQAVTMDYRTDRLTLTTQDNIVIDATWG